ncbi:dienelactone hydrolase family protein [Amycolatopsis cihanbeyliensis]|uniref:Dienelactone hydrolase n=1 Tax=Amycolatopsis cihanbeyliensis TaxID=1128664 RepID=A0A542CTE5_AMYCI|nr:alpha/beta family hydrolase [Amycolatopsis cihanbeyliensis]TQI94064.1 dienelactone hydrolase [Amycolatopsis cihanbeyliensis]
MVGSTPVVVEANGTDLAGDLAVPPGPAGLVVFAHGSGSSRHSSRNQAVATALRRHGLATLLLDLLTPDEDRTDAGTGTPRFDIPLLAERVGAAVDRFREHGPVRGVPVGLFGASTGAAAALVAASEQPVGAVVSRGGRPDLAGPALARVSAPTLLVVGGRDEQVLELNREAAARLQAPHRIEVVAGASHLFEEPGALDQVAGLAADWFERHLRE